MIELSAAQKRNRLADYLALAHHKRMGAWNDDVVSHARKLRPLNRNFSVIRAADQQTIYPIYRAIPGNDTHKKPGCTQSVGQGMDAGAKFSPDRAVDRRKKPPGPKSIDQFAPLIWRPEHNHPAYIVVGMPGKVASHQNAAQGMGDEMYPRCSALSTIHETLANHGFTEFFDCSGSGRIVDVDYAVASLRNGLAHRFHRSAGSAETM